MLGNTYMILQRFERTLLQKDLKCLVIMRTYCVLYIYHRFIVRFFRWVWTCFPMGLDTCQMTVTKTSAVLSEKDISKKRVGFLPVLPYHVTQHDTVYIGIKNFYGILQHLDQVKLPGSNRGTESSSHYYYQ